MMSKSGAITTSSTIEAFHQYFDNMDDPFIDYLALGIQNLHDKTSTAIMSRQNWQDEFYKNEYAEFDPLRKTVLSTPRTIFSIDDIDYCDKRGAEIMQRRHYHDIRGGFVLVKRMFSHNIMITCATGYSKFDFGEYLAKYSANIKRLQDDLHKIIADEVGRFMPHRSKTLREM